MNVFLIVLFAVLFLILIIILPVKMKIGLHANFMNMEGYYWIHLLGVNLLCGKASFVGEKFVFQNKNNKIIKNNKMTKDQAEMMKQLLWMIEIVNIDIFKTFGNDENAMNTAIFCGVEGVIFDILESILKTKNRILNVYSIVDPSYVESQNQTTLYVVVKISFFDVIISFIKAKLKKEKSTQS